jgi:hypothetical protein
MSKNYCFKITCNDKVHIKPGSSLVTRFENCNLTRGEDYLEFYTNPNYAEKALINYTMMFPEIIITAVVISDDIYNNTEWTLEFQNGKYEQIDEKSLWTIAGPVGGTCDESISKDFRRKIHDFLNVHVQSKLFNEGNENKTSKTIFEKDGLKVSLKFEYETENYRLTANNTCCDLIEIDAVDIRTETIEKLKGEIEMLKIDKALLMRDDGDNLPL